MSTDYLTNALRNAPDAELTEAGAGTVPGSLRRVLLRGC